jgi:F0F1-type ATP synthase membrane subunit b/b'
MEILHELVDLVVQAVPTVIIVVIFYLCMRSLFFVPLQRAMDERARRIDGAKAEAAAAQAAAREELDRYHDALKKARAEVYLEQESARQAVLDERAKLLRTLRARTLEMVQEAKARIDAESQTARAEIQKQTPVLADQISKMILERSAPAGGSR